MTRQISMTTRKELVAALQVRYRSSGFGERIKILDEFVALTGYHRKHAIRLLRAKPSAPEAPREGLVRMGMSSRAADATMHF